MITAHAVKAKALELGFDACGIAPAADLPEPTFFQTWLDRGYAGEMAYLRRSADRRADVRHILPSARSVIATATVYNVDRPYSIESIDRERALIARYAWGDDYHTVIAGRLDALVAWMRTASVDPFEARGYVDTGPVQERAYAQRAGLGWIGKNACVINAELGSWIFLAEIVCSLPLEPDLPSFDRCGHCTLCLEACPTGALVEPGVLDSTRCISYLTIEFRGEPSEPLRAAVGTHVFGCDICQEVCPWNAGAPMSDDPRWQPRAAWDDVTVGELAERSDEELRVAMAGSAIRRATLPGLRRNIAVAASALGGKRPTMGTP